MNLFTNACVCLGAFFLVPVVSASAQQVGVESEALPEIAPTFAVVSRLVAVNNLGSYPWRSLLRDIPETEERELRENYAIPVYKIINQKLGADTNALACSMAVELTRSTPEQVKKFNQAVFEFNQKNPTGDLYRNLLYVRDLTTEQKQALKGLRVLETQLFFEADKNAIVYMSRGGFDPRGCLRYVAVYQEFDPSNPERGLQRLENFRRLLENVSKLNKEGKPYSANIPKLKWEFDRVGMNFNLLVDERNNQ